MTARPGTPNELVRGDEAELIDPLIGTELIDPLIGTKSFKSIGFNCKNDIGVW